MRILPSHTIGRTVTLARTAAAEALTDGTYQSLAGAAGFGDINNALPAD